MKQKNISGNQILGVFIGGLATNLENHIGTTSDEFLSTDIPAAVPYDTMYFDKSWEWIMPVVKKAMGIDEIKDRIEESLIIPLLNCDIKEVNKILIEAIIWYNVEKTFFSDSPGKKI